jgi:outer membrane protein insertion porin family
MRKILLISLITAFTLPLYAQTITKITVRGNKKITADAIKGKLSEKEGGKFDEGLVERDIQSVFDLGYFDNVDVYKNTDSGFELIFEVKEKPIVSSIAFEGNSEIDSEDLQKQIDIKPYTVLNITEIKKTKTKLLKYYEEKGFYLASIKDELRTAPKDEEAETKEDYRELVFKISENSKIKVDKITILGNKSLLDEELRAIIETKEKSTFSWFSGSGNYRESIVDIDRERIGYFYTTRGFPHVQVFGPITHVTPDKKWIYLTYTVEEGQKYDFGEMTVKAGDVLFTDEELKEAMNIHEGDVYNSMKVREQIIIYQNMYGDKGYAFTNVVPVPTYNDETKKVEITFEIDKGRLVYFGKFKITGNNKTRDKVVRREMRIYEGDLYNNSKKELSRDKIMALGYFDDVIFNQYVPKDPDAKPDTVNIDIEVKEKSSTGQFMISAGYSTYEGFITMLQVQENNFMGRGQVVTLRANLSKVAKLYYLSFYDPYFLDSNWGWGLDLFRESRQANGFETYRTGFNTRFSYPLTDFVRGYVTYKLEHSKTTWVSTLDDIFDPSVENGFASSMTLTLEHDKRNDRLNPTKGMYNALSMEVAGLGGNKRFIKTIFDNRFYRGLFWNTIFKTRLLIGNVEGYGGKKLPYSERFLMGGIDSLRGYEYLSLGPKVTATDGTQYAVGGTNEVLWTTEWDFPIASQVGIRGVLFFDAGNSFNTFTSGITTDVPLRANWGMGFRWFSPMGPLRFEWGVPINKRPNENAVIFQFMIGPSF